MCKCDRLWLAFNHFNRIFASTLIHFDWFLFHWKKMAKLNELLLAWCIYCSMFFARMTDVFRNICGTGNRLSSRCCCSYGACSTWTYFQFVYYLKSFFFNWIRLNWEFNWLCDANYSLLRWEIKVVVKCRLRRKRFDIGVGGSSFSLFVEKDLLIYLAHLTRNIYFKNIKLIISILVVDIL